MDSEIFIEEIEFCGYEDQQCIEIDNPNGLFIIGDRCEIITHNSTLTMLILLYVATCFGLMRGPQKYFNKSMTTVFCICLCAVTITKANEIYTEPIQQLIESADFWYRCRTHDEMIREDKRLMESDSIEYIPWSTAQPLNSKVYLPDGSFKRMGDTKIGDIIASPTEGETTIIDIPFEGIAPCYEIELDDGRKTRCSIDHKWKVSWRCYSSGERIWEIVDTRFLIEHNELEFEIFNGQ